MSEPTDINPDHPGSEPAGQAATQRGVTAGNSMHGCANRLPVKRSALA
jgi:hypothetical protein